MSDRSALTTSDKLAFNVMGGAIESETRFPGAREITLEKAREIPLADMNQAELTVVILHDPDLSIRRQALRLLKLEIVLDCETRTLNALNEARR